MTASIKCLELRNLSKPPTPLRSVNFRHTTPGSGVVLVTKHKSQSTSDLFDPTYPGAHLSLDKRRSLAPRWVSPHLSLFAFPKAFLTKPDVPFSKPYKLRPYPAPTTPAQREQRRAVDMSMQVLAFKSRVVLRPVVRTKIKRRLKEAIRLIVTRGAAVEESCRGPRIVFRAEDVGAEKWIMADWTYMVLPTTELFRMPFAEQVGLMRKALGAIHHCIPKVERILRRSVKSEAR
ncbi:hypothetical protein F5148DRAFT_1208066 [Russula earlei]|uniref:Uncharacterized protein n=1 Tax=Russula earlei TaxID=71964 RepID=A0ACC0U7P9_9AGAM|nr:hypothetical protein F5148DRAFT_1208066 [Russula earlei]